MTNAVQELRVAVTLTDGVDAWTASLANVDVNEFQGAITAANRANDEAMLLWFEMEFALNKNSCPCPQCSGECALAEPPDGFADLMFDFMSEFEVEPQRDVDKLIERVSVLYKEAPKFSESERAEIVAAWTSYLNLQKVCTERAQSVFRLLGVRDSGCVCSECRATPNEEANARVLDLIWHCIRYSPVGDIDAAKILGLCVNVARGKANSGCEASRA